ncbi:MAG: B12-binding domain-containing radical SAM protein, partial [Desulfobulbia bacterium]
MTVVLFTDATNVPVPIKTRGAYNVANSLRSHGYQVRVINELMWILANHEEEFLWYLEDIISSETELIGFSTTFLSAILRREDKETVWSNGMATWDRDGTRPIDNHDHFILDSGFERFIRTLRFLAPNAKIIMGGDGQFSNYLWHTGLFDHWIRGLAENSILKFLSTPNPPPEYNFDTLGIGHDFHNVDFRWHESDAIMPGEVLPLELSRGCRFKCKFCSFPLLGRNPKDLTYIRSAESIAAELRDNYVRFGTKNYMILCDTFNESNEKLDILARARDMASIDFSFSCYIRIELLHKFPQQIKNLKNLGTKSMHFGIESFNYESGKSIGKGLRKEAIIETLEQCREEMPDTLRHASLIAGLPHETPETFNEWAQELCDGKTPLTSFNVKALRIAPDPKKNTVLFSSEFDLNAEKYGYDRSGKNWKNEY